MHLKTLSAIWQSFCSGPKATVCNWSSTISIMISSAFLRCVKFLKTCGGNLVQDRRWNADKPSAALDPYIPTWLTTSPANHRPANFWIFFFLNIGRKLWKVVQSQVELMKTNLKFEAPILWFFSTNNHLHYLSVYNGNVNIFSQYVTQDKLMIFSVTYRYRKSIYI